MQPSYLHFESDLGVEDRWFTHLIRVFFDERFKKSCPLVAVGRPVEGVMKISADGFVGPFWAGSFPCVCEIDIRTIYTQKLLNAYDKTFHDLLAFFMVNWPVVGQVDQFSWFLLKVSTSAVDEKPWIKCIPRKSCPAFPLSRIVLARES